MLRGAVVAVAMLAGARAAAAGPVHHHVGLDTSLELGILGTSYLTATGSYARRLWNDRLYVEGRLGLGAATAQQLGVIEERVGVGLAFRPSRKVELLVGWRLGHTAFVGSIRTFEGDEAFDVHLVAIELAVQIALELAPGWQVRVSPLTPQLFYNHTYSGSFGLELGVARAL